MFFLAGRRDGKASLDGFSLVSGLGTDFWSKPSNRCHTYGTVLAKQITRKMTSVASRTAILKESEMLQ